MVAYARAVSSRVTSPPPRISGSPYSPAARSSVEKPHRRSTPRKVCNTVSRSSRTAGTFSDRESASPAGTAPWYEGRVLGLVASDAGGTSSTSWSGSIRPESSMAAYRKGFSTLPELRRDVTTSTSDPRRSARSRPVFPTYASTSPVAVSRTMAAAFRMPLLSRRSDHRLRVERSVTWKFLSTLARRPTPDAPSAASRSRDAGEARQRKGF
jgi:hypothetical protein